MGKHNEIKKMKRRDIKKQNFNLKINRLNMGEKKKREASRLSRILYRGPNAFRIVTF